MADLTEFAEANPGPVRGSVCWTCHLPQARQINAAKRDRLVSVPQMLKWLVHDQGIPATEARASRLYNHFQAQHHVLYPDGRS